MGKFVCGARAMRGFFVRFLGRFVKRRDCARFFHKIITGLFRRDDTEYFSKDYTRGKAVRTKKAARARGARSFWRERAKNPRDF